MTLLRSSLLFCAAVLLALGCTPPPRTVPDGPAHDRAVTVAAHDLTVRLVPREHRLEARDLVSLRLDAGGGQRIAFTLNPALTIRGVRQRVGTDERPLEYRVLPGSEADPAATVTLEVPSSVEAGSTLRVVFEYAGVVNDPPQPSPHLRFVAPSETSGHIGEEGVYLSHETRWYPDLAGSLATYDVRVTVPAGWEVVTQGREVSRERTREAVTTAWRADVPAEALTLVANRFVKQVRTWRGLELATYLFPEDADLAEDYLAAIQRYLEVYTELLGPYPFPKFAVVENFFPSGLGMPSFTLLGSGVIKRRYTQPYALGHEIVHSWLGNAVFNDVDQGNWVEGLTTYLANYYFEELTGPPARAIEERRRMVVGYAVYVWPDEDYPLEAFHRKTDQKDNAIGYQKAAMVFHMLRRTIGEDAFWSGLRAFIQGYAGRYATWRDLEQQFSRTSGRDLRWFFAQWVERPGAPELTLDEDGAALEDGGGGEATLTFALRQRQPGAPYRLRVPTLVTLAGGGTAGPLVDVDSRRSEHRMRLPARPTALRVDPRFDVFRRLAREWLPPMLNLYVTDRSRSLLVPSGGAPGAREPYEQLASRIASREEGKGIRQVLRLDPEAREGSVLLLGGPGLTPGVEWAVQGCPESVRLEDRRFTIGGRTYDGREMALLVSCRHPERPEHVVTIFYGLTPDAAAQAARLLFFYGWDSYLVFQEGRPVARGDFEPENSPLEVTFTARDQVR